jgi:glucokinase
MAKYTVGVDVGGTNIKFGLVNAKGEIVGRSRLQTKSFISNKKVLINEISQSIKELIKSNGLLKKEVLGVGFGLPGLINPQKGLVNFLPNIPGWENVPLKQLMQKQLRIPTYLDNDVNLITLGEWKYGAGVGYSNLVCMTLGTGVGAGLILNNSLYRGEGFVAGELGHMPLNEKGPKCNCGGEACFERYVGNGVLQKKLEKVFKKKGIVFPDVHHLGRKGDKRVLKFWEEAADHVGNGLVGIVNLLNPRLIIIGGGVSNNLVFMKKRIHEVIKKRAMKVQSGMVKIVRAKLDDDAGIIGACVLVNRGINE